MFRLASGAVKNRLVGYAQWYVSKQGYRFGVGAESAIEHILERAVRKIRSEIRGASEDQAEVVVRKAEVAVRRLIRRMIVESKRIPQYASRHPGIVGEDTLKNALKKLCPLWPICGRV